MGLPANFFLYSSDNASFHSTYEVGDLYFKASNDGITYGDSIQYGTTGSGPVTTFSAGDLTPLFTTDVANPTTTPALSFELSTQAANLVFAGPATGAAAAPTFRTLQALDIPTLNQNTTGSAATLTTPRAIYGNNFNGSAALDQIIASTYGGTGNGFTKFTGPATAEKTFTLPNASATILTTNAAVTVAQGGTGITTYAEGDLLFGNAGGSLSKLADPGLPGYTLISDSGLPTWVLLASQAVTALAGTANEITASASVGSVTLSLPTALTFTGKTVTGGTFNGGAFNGTVGATTRNLAEFTGIGIAASASSGFFNMIGTDGALGTPPAFAARDFLRFQNNSNCNWAAATNSTSVFNISAYREGDSASYAALRFGAPNRDLLVLIGNGTSGALTVTRFASSGVEVTGIVDINGTAASATAGHLQIGSSTQTTIGSNGAASALTANPLGYLSAYLGSTHIIIPYYNA